MTCPGSNPVKTSATAPTPGFVSDASPPASTPARISAVVRCAAIPVRLRQESSGLHLSKNRTRLT